MSLSTNRKTSGEHAENDVAFTVGVIALAAKMAKADGVVTKDEVKAFKSAFKVSDAEMKQGARVFNLAKQNVDGYEDCAEQLDDCLQRQPQDARRSCSTAFSTSPRPTRRCIQAEQEFLGEVAKRFGSPTAQFAAIRARHVVAAKTRSLRGSLGLKPSASDAELEDRYRALLAENRPDELIGRGVPPEFIAIAIEKVAAFTEAYKAVAKPREL